MTRKGIIVIAMLLAAVAARAFDFRVAAATGQQVYYSLLNSTTVAVVNPGWNSYTPPTGFLALPATVEHDGITYQVKAIDAQAYRGCDELTGISVPEGVTSIGRMAFAFCTALDSIVLPTTLTEIGSTAFTGTAYFGNADRLTPEGLLFIGPYLVASRPSIDRAIDIPEGTLGLGNMALYSCEHMPQTTLPSTLRFIGENAFGGCSALDTLTMLAEVPPTLADNSFQGVTPTLVVSVPCGSADTYQAAAHWSLLNVTERCDTTGIEPPERTAPTALAVEGGLLVTLPEGGQCSVHDMSGHTLALLRHTAFVPLTQHGIYLVHFPSTGKTLRVAYLH